jgi:hypothetical protein
MRGPFDYGASYTPLFDFSLKKARGQAQIAPDMNTVRARSLMDRARRLAKPGAAQRGATPTRARILREADGRDGG